MKDYIIKHVRDKKGNPYETLVGYREGNRVIIGHAKCNKKFDTFRKDRGVEIALNRAKKHIHLLDEGKFIICDKREDQIEDEKIRNFSERCKKYFKSDYIFYKPESRFGEKIYSIKV